MEINIKRQPSIERIEQGSGVQGMYEQIERCGRNCYRSTPKGGESAKTFVDAMVSSNHLAMLEHGTVYLTIPEKEIDEDPHPIVYDKYTSVNRVLKCRDRKAVFYVTTNYRVLVEHGWLDLLEYWSEPMVPHEKRVTILFDTSIGISREFNRHRVNSVAESSTRYCNYSKDKFDNAITVVEPDWLRNREVLVSMTAKDKTLADCMGEVCLGQDKNWEPFEYWLLAVETTNYCYQKLIELGCKPQEARGVLPLDTNTQLIHTAFVSDWQHFIELRAKDKSTNHPHPMAMELAAQVEQLLNEKGLL